MSRLPLDPFTLAAVAAELRRTAVGARVQKVQQPAPAEVVLSLFGRAGAQRLLVSADPTAPRLHLTAIKRENPPAPPAFCQVARKYLEGAWLEAVTLPALDRVVHLLFRAGDGERVALIAELMGRNANVVLTSGAGTVRGVLRPLDPESPRPLRPGVPYRDPPGLGAAPPSGKFLEAEIAARGPGGREALEAAVRDEAFAPHALADADGHTVGVWAFEPLSVPPARRFPRESVSLALDTFYATWGEERSDESARAALARAIARERAARERAADEARRTLEEAGRAERYEQDGSLLLAHAGRIERGQSEVTVDDLFAGDGGQRTIALEPGRSPQENAQRCFERARKARDAAEYADGKLADAEDEIARLDDLRDALAQARDADAVAALEAEMATILRPGPAAPRPAASPRRAFGGHRVRTLDLDGWTLLVGESAEANDHLLTRVAAPSDLWMHIRGTTGAHGVLRTNGHPERVPESIVRRAAAAVAARSKTEKHAGVVPVDIAERRYVRKPRGAKPGLAVYTRARTVDVEPKLP